MHIERLELKNYTGFEDFSLDFPKGNLTIFIGENGSGKTSIINAIEALFGEIDYLLLNKRKREELADNLINTRKEKEIIEIIKYDLSIQIKVVFEEKIYFEWAYVKRIDDWHYQQNVSYKYPEEKLFKKNIISIFPKIDRFNKIVPFYLCFQSVIQEEESVKSFLDWYIQSVYHESYLSKKFNKEYSLKAAIDKAIEVFSEIKIDTKIAENGKELAVFFLKNGYELSFTQLSEGERKTIYLISKILAHFVFPFEENGNDILSFYGIVLIDEIETHLHPRWQREILPNLTKTFPNVQFIVTTHSPQVISSVPKEAVFLLKDFKAIPVQSFTQGRDSNALLTEVFDVPERPEGAMLLLANFYQSINDKKAAAAEKYLKEMRLSWGELDSEVIKATWDFEELLNEREEEIA